MKTRVTLALLCSSVCWGKMWAGYADGLLIGYWYEYHPPIMLDRVRRTA